MKISISGLPISSNQALCINHGRLVPTYAANSYNKHTTKAIREAIEALILSGHSPIPEIKSMATQNLQLHINLVSNSWFNIGNGKIKKKDCQNQSKALIDILFKVLREFEPTLDDSQIFDIRIMKQVKINREDDDTTELELKIQ